MRKVKNLDFIIYEDNDEEIVFRFHPRQSSCHSFGDEPPKSWSDVYKVYYHYKIFRRWKEDGQLETLFDSGCDECSVIRNITERIRLICEGKKEIEAEYFDEKRTIQLLDIEIYPMGYGVSWTIKECRLKDHYEIILWDFEDRGYRFSFEKSKFKEFGEYLYSCCEYMLTHGDPI